MYYYVLVYRCICIIVQMPSTTHIIDYHAASPRIGVIPGFLEPDEALQLRRANDNAQLHDDGLYL